MSAARHPHCDSGARRTRPMPVLTRPARGTRLACGSATTWPGDHAMSAARHPPGPTSIGIGPQGRPEARADRDRRSRSGDLKAGKRLQGSCRRATDSLVIRASDLAVGPSVRPGQPCAGKGLACKTWHQPCMRRRRSGRTCKAHAASHMQHPCQRPTRRIRRPS